MDRDFSKARAKVDAEGCCRRCGSRDGLAAAHVAYRRFDPQVTRSLAVVMPDDVVPLCLVCHSRYDAHELDILPYLSLREQARCAYHLGIARAYERTTGARLMGG